jgi:hypothetical protein
MRGPGLARVGSVAAIAGTLLLVFSGTWCGFPPDAHLAGAEKTVKKPAWRLAAWLDGSCAAAVEPWLNRNIGCRGIGIRTANQINYSLFGRVPTSSGTPILVGDDFWLYEAGYVRARAKPQAMPEAAVKQLVQDLERMQTQLARRGTAFVLVISPSKPEIVPEHLPAPLVATTNEVLAKPSVYASGYEQLAGALRGSDIATVDAHADFLQWKSDGVALFPPGGTHWNHYGAQRVLERVWQVLREQAAGVKLDELPSLTGYRMSAPAGTDVDLLKLLNLWWFEPGGPSPVPFPTLAEARPPRKPLRIAIVGDSFAYTLVDALARAGVTGTVDLFYYARRHFHYDLTVAGATPSPQDLGPVDHKQVPVHPGIRDADVVILEINEHLVRSCGWGFPAAAARLLESGDGTGNERE